MPAMRFEAMQSMRLGQQMKLAPRMIQSMEILQMATAELEERIEAELESNPALDLAERTMAAEEARHERDEAREESRALDRELDVGGSGEDDFARLDRFESDHPEYADNSYDGGAGAERSGPRTPDDWHERSYSGSRLAGERDAKTDAMMSAAARPSSVTEQLLGQWSLCEVREDLRPLGALIIEALDGDGLLREPLASVLERGRRAVREGRAPGQTRAPTDEDMELALRAVQLLIEPAGIGARDIRECMLIQLDAMAEAAGEGPDRGDEPDREDGWVLRNARLIVSEHLDDLLKNRLPRIGERAGLSMGEIRAALTLMRRLRLAPARALATESAAPMVPDAVVEYDEDSDRYIAYLNDSRIPNLRVNREYALMARDREVPTKDRDFLRTSLSNANWLIAAVEQRRATLLRVVQVVVDEQREYFDLGPEALRPLPMTDVAERLGIHVATVSRAVNGKHVRTPRGVVPLRSFFSGGLATESGDDMSYDAVRAAVKEVVDDEDRAEPLSDDAIARILNERGIDIARRTVAKYRGQLGIPAARMRRTFA